MGEEKGNILKFLRLDKLFDNLTGYIETRIELVKLDLKEQAEETLAGMLQSLVIIILGVIVLLFFSLALAVMINTLTKSNFWGYLSVGFLYLVMLLFVLLDKNKRLAKWFITTFIRN